MKRFRKALAVVMCVVMTLTAAPLSGFVGMELPDGSGFKKIVENISAAFDSFSTKAQAAYSGTCGDNLTWSLDTSTGVLNITGTGAMTNWSSSSSSSAPWYSYCSYVKTVNIGNSVTTISNYAFYECTRLTSVTIPDSVTTIGNHAFCECTRLTDIIIPDGVTTIGDYAFGWCDSLTSVTIPDSVTTIGSHAFADCDGLTSVTIPDSVTTIGTLAFFACVNLTSITVDANNNKYSSDSDGVLYNKDKTELIQYPIGNARTSYTISNNVATIGGYAFSHCENLTNITIGNSVTTIDYYAFFDCENLSNITIGNSVKTIRSEAFYHCISLTNVTIPDGVVTIDNYVFRACTSLTSIDIPDSVTYIGHLAFYECDNLTSINVDSNSKYYSSDSDGVLFNKDKTTIIQYPTGNIRENYRIPDSVTTIGNSAFEDCDSLTSVTIGNSVTTINSSTFAYCSNLTSVTIGNGVTSIDYYAFYICDSLTDVYYSGSEEQWKAISIGEYNEPLLNATIHYNYVADSCEFALNPGFRAILNSERTYIYSENGTYDTDSFEIDLLIKNDETFIEGVTASQTETISAVITLPKGFSFSQSGDVLAKRIEFSPIAVGDSAEETLTVYVTDPEIEIPLQISAEIFKENSSEPIRKTFCSITATSDESFLEFELPNDVYISNDKREAGSNTISTMSEAKLIELQDGPIGVNYNTYVVEKGSYQLNAGQATLKKNLVLKSGSTLEIKGVVVVEGNVEIESGANLVVYGTLNCKNKINIKQGGTLDVKRGQNHVGNGQNRGWVQAKNIIVDGNLNLNGAMYVEEDIKCTNKNAKITTFSTSLGKPLVYAGKIHITDGTHTIDYGEFFTKGIKGNANFKTQGQAKIILIYKNGVLPTAEHHWWSWPNLVSIYVDQDIKKYSDEKKANNAIENILKCSSNCKVASVEYNGNFVSKWNETGKLVPITNLQKLKDDVKANAQTTIKLQSSINPENSSQYQYAVKCLKECIYISRAFLLAGNQSKELLDLSSKSASLDFTLENGYRFIYDIHINAYGNYGSLLYGNYNIYSKNGTLVDIGSIGLEANYNLQAFGNSVDEYVAKEWNKEIAEYFGDGFSKMLVKDVLFRYGLEKVFSVPLESVTSISIQGVLTNPKQSYNLNSDSMLQPPVVIKDNSADDLLFESNIQRATSIQNSEIQVTYSSLDLTPKKGFEDKYLIHAVLSYLGITSLDALTDDFISTVTTLDLSNQNIKNLEGLQIFANLQTLYIDNNFIYDLTPLEELENLTYLSADNNCFTEIAPIKSLEYFSAADCLLYNIDAVNSMSALSYLDISTNYIFAIDAILNALSIVLLNISGNNLSPEVSIQTQSVESSTKLCTPVYLYADNCGLTELSMFDLTNIKEISVSGNDLVSTDYINMPNAEKIDFSDNEITELGFVEKSPNLKSLDVSYNNISDLQQEFEKASKAYDYLNLDGNKLRNTDENHKVLESISKNIDNFESVELGVPVSRIEFTLEHNLIDIKNQVSLAYIAYPLEAETNRMVWSSSDKNVLVVENGIITPKALGEAVVTVSNTEGEILGSTVVNVVEFETVNVEDLLISEIELSVMNGETAQLQALCLPLNATTKTVSWESDNPSIVSVNQNGLISAVKVGTAIITATSNDGKFTVQCKVTVEPRQGTVIWSVDGNITEQFVYEGEVITPPTNPEKVGYKFIGWTPSVPSKMPANDLTFTAQFELLVKEFKVKNPSTNTVKYGDTLILHADFGDAVLPEGYTILWTVEGAGFNMAPAADGLTCKMTSVANGNATVTATLVDENGEAVLDADGNEMSDTKELKSNASFWQKIVSFFKNLFRINRIIPE